MNNNQNHPQDANWLVEPLLTGNEVAEILKVSRSFAYTLLQRGEIPTVRIGRSVRVRPSDLEAWIQACIRCSQV